MTSVIEALARALDAFPNRVALRFLDYSDGTVTVRSHTYRQLWDEIAVAAAHLPGTPGDRVLPLIPGDDRLLILILGAMYRGMIPIPVPFPITRGPETERLHHIITDSSPTVVIATTPPQAWIWRPSPPPRRSSLQTSSPSRPTLTSPCPQALTPLPSCSTPPAPPVIPRESSTTIGPSPTRPSSSPTASSPGSCCPWSPGSPSTTTWASSTA